MTQHPDRNPDLEPEPYPLSGLFPKREATAARPGTFAAAAFPTGEERVTFYSALPTEAVVLQWNAEGQHYEWMLAAATLESAVRTAAALNANEES